MSIRELNRGSKIDSEVETQGFPKVVILMLNYNQREKTRACLNSIRSVDYHNLEVVVVDNGSTDGSQEIIKKEFPEVILIKNKKNFGAAGGRNIGIKHFLKTDSKYLFSIDNDVILDKDVLKELVEVTKEDGSMGVIGPKLYYFSEPNKIWSAGGANICWLKGTFYDSGQGEIDKGQFEKKREVDSVPGAMTFAKKEVYEKTGLLDERFFIYYEDSDWCVRVRKAGYKLVFAPKAKLWHCPSSSLGMESPGFYYYRTRNRLLFMQKNTGRLSFCAFLFYFVYDFTCKTLLTLYLSRKKKEFKAAILGVLDFWRGKFGQRNFSEPERSISKWLKNSKN